MSEYEEFIRENISSLLSHRQIKSKIGTIGLEWRLANDEITAYHGTPKNVEFTVILENGDHCIKVTAKINRDTAKLSNIVVEDI